MQRSVLIALVSIIATVVIIYCTPLKHLNLIAPEPRDITPTEFQKLYEQNPDHYLFFDVRSKEAYDIVHARGSISQPIASLYDMRTDLPYSGKTIVLICSTGRLAGVAYGFLQNWGHLNLLRVQGGIQQWIVEGQQVDGSDVTFVPKPD